MDERGFSIEGLVEEKRGHKILMHKEGYPKWLLTILLAKYEAMICWTKNTEMQSLSLPTVVENQCLTKYQRQS